MACDIKTWGNKPFWGLGYEFDQDWFLTASQMELRKEVMEICRTRIRPRAAYYDQTSTFPQDSINDLAEIGLLGLLIPKELGGTGENLVCATMVIETIARYGCPSTSMVYTMHNVALQSLLMLYDSKSCSPFLEDFLRNVCTKKLLGTSSLSDPATGGHFLAPLSSKTKYVDDDHLKLLRFGSWCTSAGHADWYVMSVATPCVSSQPLTTLYLVTKENVRTYADDWKALGLRGNCSSPVVFEGILNKERMIGHEGEGGRIIAETLLPLGGALTGANFNGIAMAALDLARRHVTTKTYGDVGLRICDYPTIQDIYGESLSSAITSRMTLFTHMQHMDKLTNGCDWTHYRDPDFSCRQQYSMYVHIVKCVAAKTAAEVTDNMMRICGGEGFKEELGIERLLRDSRASWLMSPSNEIAKQHLGKLGLFGHEIVENWDRKANQPILLQEVKKLDRSAKEKLAKQLLQELQAPENDEPADEDFDNPFSTSPPLYYPMVTCNGVRHDSALNPHTYIFLSLIRKDEFAPKTFRLQFSLPKSADHLGCLPGQYVQMRVGNSEERYFSPISDPEEFGVLEIATRLEGQGTVSQVFSNMTPGDAVEFRGPCGGFEYTPRSLGHLILIGSGIGATPALQLVRCIAGNPLDATSVTFIFCANREEDLLLKHELDQFAADKRISVNYILRNPDSLWNGLEGTLDSAKMETLLPTANDTKKKVLLCGGPTFVISCLQSLRILDWPSHHIFVYGQFGTEYVRNIYGRTARLSSHRSQD